MTPYYERDGITLYCGDNREVLPALDVAVSAVVTDPPAGIAFMNKAWDGHKGGREQWVTWLASVLADCERVMLPGAHALVWALPRTSGWTHRAIEDAGLDVRDCVTHLFGSGFPKSHNLPGGLGTALKPAAEFWYLARKPLTGTVAANVLAHGTGALNIDASRIGTETVEAGRGGRAVRDTGIYGAYNGEEDKRTSTGRWPANVILDEDAAALLDAMSGERPSRAGKTKGLQHSGRHGGLADLGPNIKPGTDTDRGYGNDTGGASRFFKTVPQDENDRTYADFMVQYDCDCEAVEGDQWASQDRSQSIRQDSDTPRQRDTIATPSGTESAGDPSWLMSSNGSASTDLSPTECRSITSTATSKTTGSKTCNCSTPQRTSASTQDANSATANGGSRVPCAESSSESTPNTGTSVKRAGHSTDVADNAISAKSLPINSGDAMRFRYVAKASRAERRRGVPDHIEANHPTVKPLALMRYLITLVTPPGGIVLDPFAGSGTTGVACAELGVPCILIEQSDEYCEIIARRVDHALNERAGRLPLAMCAD